VGTRSPSDVEILIARVSVDTGSDRLLGANTRCVLPESWATLSVVQITRLGPQLHLIKPVFGQRYVWQDASQLTIVDTAIRGSQDDLASASAELGFRRCDLRRVVLTRTSTTPRRRPSSSRCPKPRAQMM
jgi:hypothetical protein